MRAKSPLDRASKAFPGGWKPLDRASKVFSPREKHCLFQPEEAMIRK